MDMDEFYANTIADRELVGGSHRVTIRISKPLKIGHNETRYYYHIDGLGSETIRYVPGIDGIQAFQLTLLTIRNEIMTSKEYIDGKIKWFPESKSGDIGIP